MSQSVCKVRRGRLKPLPHIPEVALRRLRTQPAEAGLGYLLLRLESPDGWSSNFALFEMRNDLTLRLFRGMIKA
jgi:hypothetical protein